MQIDTKLHVQNNVELEKSVYNIFFNYLKSDFNVDLVLNSGECLCMHGLNFVRLKTCNFRATIMLLKKRVVRILIGENFTSAFSNCQLPVVPGYVGSLTLKFIFIEFQEFRETRSGSFGPANENVGYARASRRSGSRKCSARRLRY